MSCQRESSCTKRLYRYLYEKLGCENDICIFRVNLIFALPKNKHSCSILLKQVWPVLQISDGKIRSRKNLSREQYVVNGPWIAHTYHRFMIFFFMIAVCHIHMRKSKPEIALIVNQHIDPLPMTTTTRKMDMRSFQIDTSGITILNRV